MICSRLASLLVVVCIVLSGCTNKADNESGEDSQKHVAEQSQLDSMTSPNRSEAVDSKDSAVGSQSMPCEFTTVDENTREAIAAIFSKDTDRSLTFENAAIVITGTHRELDMMFTVDWVHAKVAGKLYWGLSPSESVVYQAYLTMFQHAREVAGQFPDIQQMSLLCCNKVSVTDKYGNQVGLNFEPVFYCCQSRDMVQNLNKDNVIRTMYMHGTKAAAQYFDCTQSISSELDTVLAMHQD
jgi:hypothetical protein